MPVLYLGQPVGVLGVAAVDDVKERTLDFFGDRAAAAATEFDAVEFANRCDFSGGAGEEGFVGDIDLVAGDALLYDFQPQILADVEHGVAGDAVQGASGQVGRVDHAVLDDKDVLARAFGHKTGGIE